MRKIIVVFILLYLFTPPFLQAQKPVKKDVDILYSKYKTSDSVRVENASVELVFCIDKNVNKHGLPINIILSSYSGPLSSKSEIQDILNKLMRTKEKAGYKFMGLVTELFKGEIISVSVYQKGTQYAKYGMVDHEYNSLSIPYNSEEERKTNEARALKESLKGDFIYMEVGDLSRKDDATLEKFSF